MWNPNIQPTPLTTDSLKTNRERRWQRNKRGKTFPINRIQETVVSSIPDPRLRSGSYLPAYLRLFFPPQLGNVPLEDLDPFYAKAEKFVIVTEKKIIHRFSAQNSLIIFSPLNPLRRKCISVLHHWLYRWFMIVAAFLDCCLLIQPYNDHQPIVFYIFGAIYTIDFVTNVIAKGLLFDQFTFLRDAWGIVDLLLVVSYYVPLIGRHHFLCGLRSLKIAALIPSLKSMVKAVLKTGGDLRDMFLWTMFTTWIFALVGYHLFMDISTQKCVRHFPEDGSVGKSRDINWQTWISNSSNWKDDSDEITKCGNHTRIWSLQCYGNYTCLQIHDQNDELYSSVGWALKSTILIMLQDSWDNIYEQIVEMGGPWHVPYFIVTLFLGSFYTLNIILAVVSKSCDDLQQDLKTAKKLDSGEYKRSRSNISASDCGDLEVTNESNDNDNINEDSSCKNPIKNIWTRFIKLINVIAFDPFTELIMAFATIGNLILLSMDRYGVEENQQLQMILVSGSQVFGAMFAMECLLKFLACGTKSYFKEKWNIFDFWQTILFLVESKFEYNTRWMKTLLSLRSLRIFQVTRIWPKLDFMLNGIFSAMGKVSDMTIVAIGLFYILCVAGVHLFGGKIETPRPWSYWHFRDFGHSFITMFRLLCGQWQDSMSECMDDYGWTCIPFFVSSIIVLDMVVLNLLLVMFLQRFAAGNLSAYKANGKSDMSKLAIAFNRFKRLGMWMKVKFGTCVPQKALPDSAVQEKQNIETEAMFTEKSFCECSKLRKILKHVMNSKWFKYFNIGNTIIATICLSLRDEHLKSRPLLQVVLNVADNISLLFMAVEAGIKIVGMGFSAYIKIKWNCLDFIILWGGILNVIGTLYGVSSVGFFRSMRVFRLFSNFEGTRVIFNSLGRAMPKIFEIMIMCLLIWLVFAIIGFQLFNGRFHFCRDSSDVRNKKDCLDRNATWTENSLRNFDNVGSAYFRILEIITFKGWDFTFWWVTSSGEIDEHPRFEKSFWLSGYFVVVILFGSFFAFNLFTGVLVDALNMEKEQMEMDDRKGGRESGYLKARKYMLDKLKMKFCSDEAQTHMSQKRVLGIMTSKYFGYVIVGNLLLNMILLTIEQKSTNVPHISALSVLNGVSTAVFASECLLNIFAFKITFFRNPPKMFECFTELLSIFDILWTDVSMKISLLPFRPGLLRVVRFAWVSRYLRHVKAADGLRQLLFVIQISLPQFFNLCLILLLVVYVYALLGMELFKEFGKWYNQLVFLTLERAFVSLFPLITSARWDNLFSDLSVEESCNYNNENTSGVCGNDTVAIIFVLSFVFITYVILVNLFTAVILESYSRAIKLVECELNGQHLEMFYNVWSQFDTDNSQFVERNYLSDLLERLGAPLQVLKPNRCAITLMNIPIFQGNLVHCADVLDAAIFCLYFRKGVIPAECFSQYQSEMKNEKDCRQEMISSTFQEQRELRSAKIIQRAWRNRKASLTSSLRIWEILPFQYL